jgi:hypothetical protein
MIIGFARARPGGTIRWHEAETLYLQNSQKALRQHRRGMRNYAMSIQAIMKRYFVRVYEQIKISDYPDIERDAGIRFDEHLNWEPLRGYYMLKEMLDPPRASVEDCLEAPHVDEFGVFHYFMGSLADLDPFNV